MERRGALAVFGGGSALPELVRAGVPETMAPETLVPEEIAPSNPEAWLDDQHGLGIPAPGGGKCQRGSGLGVCRARRYTRNSG